MTRRLGLLVPSVALTAPAFADDDSWKAIDPLGIDACVVAVVIDPVAPATVYAAVVDPLGGGGVFKSTDGSDTWSKASRGLTVVPSLLAEPDAQ